MKILTVDTLGEYLGGLYEPSTVRSLLTRDPTRLPPPVELGGKKRKRKIWLSDAVDAWLIERLRAQHPINGVFNQHQVNLATDGRAPFGEVLKRRPGRPKKLRLGGAE